MSATAPALPRRAGARDRRAADRLRSVVRGRPADPVWVRPSLIAIVALAAALCLWDLTISGYANTYYAAAARAASESWKAWFFGALDPGSFITVDKPPLSLWLMGLSARALGFSSFSILLPQALCTIAAVGLLYATVRRVFGPVAGLVAAAVLAVSPITVAMARVDMPDALLVLLLVASAWLLVRAIETGRTTFLLWCGAVVGLAFMTKMLQGWMVVPALATAYLVAGPPRLLVRIRQLVFAGLAMVAVSAAWPLAVSLWPAASRPYIGGSTNGSVWDLIFGYNGFGRLTGAENGPGGGGGGGFGGGGFGGAPGLWRMFNEQVGAQIGWLLPFAAISPRRRAVADPPRAADRPAPRRPPALRRLGDRPRRRLLQPAGHLPPLLRERPRARGRGPGRLRRRRALPLGADLVARRRRARRRGRRDRVGRGDPARPHARLRPVAARRDPGRRRDRDRRGRRPAPRRAGPRGRSPSPP